MKIDLYAVCHNEQDMLPFFLRHYERFVDRMFIYDNQSDDHSPILLKSHPKVVYHCCSTGGLFREDWITNLKNEAWKKHSMNSDYVFVVDIDEFIYHPHLATLLKQYHAGGIECIHAYGYNMVADTFPSVESGRQIYDDIHFGVPESSFDKVSVFDPRKIDIQYYPGAHCCKGIMNARYPRRRVIKLLHYKFVDFHRLAARCASRQSRNSEINKAMNWGTYHYTEDEIRRQFQQIKEKAINVMIHRPPPYQNTLRGRIADFAFYYLRGGRRRWIAANTP